MGIKEDPGACKTTPFAQMITAKNFNEVKKVFFFFIKLVGCRLRIWYLDSGSKALRLSWKVFFLIMHAF